MPESAEKNARVQDPRALHDDPPVSIGRGRPRGVSIVTKAVRGAFWTILSGTGARLVGILGTLAITHYLSPSEYGEVSLAALVMLMATVLANCGLSQYIASKPDASRKAVFHASFYFILLGVVAIGFALAIGKPFGDLVQAPGVVKFLPGFAFAALLDRATLIQDRIQVRDMRFRLVGVQRSLGELVYAVVCVGLAATARGTIFGGGYSLVWASIARSLVRLAVLFPTTSWREWLEPHRIEMGQTRELFRFGLPMSAAQIAGFGSQKLDNIVFSHHFGQGPAGLYNLAYNLADIPASLIAEQAGDVLVPSFARMEGEKRKESLLLSMRMLVLLVTPLAVGLASVAPTLVKLSFKPEYDGIANVLRILAMLAIPRTIIWIGSSYLQVRNSPRVIMILDAIRMVAIVVFMQAVIVAGKGVYDDDRAIWLGCTSVVAVFVLSALMYMGVIRRIHKVSIFEQLLPLMPPTIASIPMAVAVYGAAHLMMSRGIFMVGHPIASTLDRVVVFAPRLLVEVIVGLVVFVPSALLLAPSASREFLKLARDAVRRRKRSGEELEDFEPFSQRGESHKSRPTPAPAGEP